MKNLIVSVLLLIAGSTSFAKDLYQVIRVVDGDTVELEQIGKVRLIGVDTPETVHPHKPVEYFGKEASAFTKNLLEGKKVKLEYDWEKRDKYGRTLCYLYLENGTFVNAEIIKQGYGHAYTRFPFKHLDQFRAHEKEAREKKLGLWADSKPEAPIAMKAVQASATNSSCLPRKTCGQMDSCKEAMYRLNTCGHRQLDGDRDGIPCEKLCGNSR